MPSFESALGGGGGAGLRRWIWRGEQGGGVNALLWRWRTGRRGKSFLRRTGGGNKAAEEDWEEKIRW